MKDRWPFSPRTGALLVNALAFETGWLACVLGGSLVGLVAVAGVIGHHFWRLAAPGEWRLLAGFAALGLAVDGGFTLAGGFTFNDAAPRFGPLPLWLWLLWPLFATLVRHALGWLWRYPWLAALCGGTGGALSYYGGSVLADVTLAPWLLPAEALVWALLCARLARHGHGQGKSDAPGY